MKKIIFFFLILQVNNLTAQQSANSSGGIGTGIGGSFSFSVGQIDFISSTGINGSVSQGVQQPFEIFTLGKDEIPEIKLELSIYPNPTTDFIFIKNENMSLKFNYQLFDITGKLIFSSDKLVQENQINMSSFDDGTYMLLIQTENSLTKSFKIIKK